MTRVYETVAICVLLIILIAYIIHIITSVIDDVAIISK